MDLVTIPRHVEASVFTKIMVPEAAAIPNSFLRRFLSESNLHPLTYQSLLVWYAEVRQLPRVSSSRALRLAARRLGRWGYSGLSANELHEAVYVYSRYHRLQLQRWLKETPSLLSCCPMVLNYLSPEEQAALSPKIINSPR
jgi:hypothetical protein